MVNNRQPFRLRKFQLQFSQTYFIYTKNEETNLFHFSKQQTIIPILLQMQFSWTYHFIETKIEKVRLLNFLRRILHLGLFLLIEAYLWDQSLNIR